MTSANEVLSNLAQWHLIEYCKRERIDCSGTRFERTGRQFVYSLVRGDELVVVSVRLTKHSSPVFGRYL